MSAFKSSLPTSVTISTAMGRVSPITTSFDSLDAKFQAAKLKYFEDQYIPCIHESLLNLGMKSSKRSPIIHRGYWIRVEAQRKAIRSFFEETGSTARKQVILLGCGYDTAPLFSIDCSSPENETKIFEIDFAEVIQTKERIYDTMFEPLPSSASRITTASEVINNPNNRFIYNGGQLNLVSHDLNGSVTDLSNKLELIGFDRTKPTLIITECVLVYLSKETIRSLYQFFGEILAAGEGPSLWFSYDMTNLDDSYGQMMHRNITRQGRGIPLPGFVAYPSLSSLESRPNDRDDVEGENYWAETKVTTMLEFYNNAPSMQEEKTRIEAIELLDEIEEWNLIMSHYALSISSNTVGAFANLFREYVICKTTPKSPPKKFIPPNKVIA